MKTRTSARWPTFLDGAFDGLVVAFAGWTVFYQLALAFQFSMLWAGWPWILVAAGLAIAAGLWTSGPTRDDVRDGLDATAPPAEQRGTRRLGWIWIAAGLALVALLTSQRDQWGVWPIAIGVSVLVAAQVLPWSVGTVSRSSRTEKDLPKTDVSQGAHLLALALSAGFGVLGLFLLRPDADDVFYVNRATWVAEYGTAATNDTMFGPNDLAPSYSGGLLTPSIEALQGVVAHAIGIQAPTLCYLLAVPLLGFMAGWTTWRLVRAWAVRSPGLVMLAAMVFLVVSGESIVGNYSLGRIWQGKATAYLILIPLVWLLLSRTIDRARRTDLVLLIAAGVAFVGLTTTSALLAPVIGGAALVAAAILRSRSLALGTLAFLAGPLINAAAQVFAPAAIGGGGDNAIPTTESAFAIAFGVSFVMIVLALAAMVLVPITVPGRVGVLLGCGVVATMVSLLPGVFGLVDAVTGAGAVAWRLVITMPIWVLVGLLAVLPGAPRARDNRSQTLLAAGRLAMAFVVIVVPVLAGTMLWKGAGASLTDRPTWKVNKDALADVRALQARDLPQSGLWLLPPEQMQVLAISTVGPYAVVPRGYYLPGLKASDQGRADRQRLLKLAAGMAGGPGGPKAQARKARVALDRLDVSVACVPRGAKGSVRVLRRTDASPPRRVGEMECVTP